MTFRTAHKGELDREIIGHARLWVARFTVTKDEIDDNRRELTVSVRIDRDKLRARLDELKIATREVVDSAEPNARTVTILYRVATPKGVRAGFGKGAAREVAGQAALTALLRDAGLAVRRSPASGTVAPDGDYPIGLAEAEVLGEAAKADLVAIAGVTVGDPVAIRGQAQPAALVTAHLQLVERKTHQVLGQRTGTAAAGADDPAYGIDRALASAAADVLPPAPKKLAQAGTWTGDDTPITQPGVVLLRLSPKTPYALVLAEQKYLAGARGIRRSSLRRLSPAGWVIGLETSDSLDKVAQLAKRPPSSGSSSAVKIVGELVEVTLSGAP